jgi:hypothetical protein
MKYDLKNDKQPLMRTTRKPFYWYRGTSEEFNLMTDAEREWLREHRPEYEAAWKAKQPIHVPTLEERIADLERRVGILERDDQG